MLDRLVPYAQRLKLTGGEPTLHPGFFDIVADVERRHLDFTLFTNGRWADPARMVNFLKGCSHLTGLLVSLHGATPLAHEAFTGVPSSFEETLENVRLAIAHDIPVAFSTVLTKFNADELPAVVSLAEQVRVSTVIFNRYLGEPIPGLTLDNEGLAQAVSHIERLQQAGLPVKYGNCVPQCFTPNSSRGCLAGVAYCTVDPWGNLRPCTLSSLRAGNLLVQPLHELWHSPTMEKFRASIPTACHQCNAFAVCHGGCKALALEMGIEADPLARPGIPLTLPSPDPITLNPAWRPTLHCKIQPEAWGLVLLYGNQLLPVQTEAQPVLDAFDGNKTVAELHDQFGYAALSLMGALLRYNMLTFAL